MTDNKKVLVVAIGGQCDSMLWGVGESDALISCDGHKYRIAFIKGIRVAIAINLTDEQAIEHLVITHHTNARVVANLTPLYPVHSPMIEKRVLH